MQSAVQVTERSAVLRCELDLAESGATNERPLGIFAAGAAGDVSMLRPDARGAVYAVDSRGRGLDCGEIATADLISELVRFHDWVEVEWRAAEGDELLGRLYLRRQGIGPPVFMDVQLNLFFKPTDMGFATIAGRVRELAATVETLGGFIDCVVGGPSGTRWEVEHDVNEWRALKNAARAARGPCWGTFLSEKHIERLGGIEAVRLGAPVDVIDLNRPAWPLVFLQAAGTPFEFDDDRRRSLGRFLRPVLLGVTGGATSVETHAEDMPPGGHQINSVEAGAGPRATFKSEDESADGEPIGPLIVYDPMGDKIMREFGWMRMSEAELIAAENGWVLSFD